MADVKTPERLLTTTLDWSDLILDVKVLEQVEDIQHWLRHSSTLFEAWGLAGRLKPGYRALFFGPPGVGKTLTACLLGKATGLAVYRIGWARLLLAGIVEAEATFDRLSGNAARQILVIDDAEGLMGRRTEARDANDRSANQQAAYLLQRLEDYPGVAIVVSNLRSHIDEAFARRFQSVIHFPVPDAEARLRLWNAMLSGGRLALSGLIDLPKIAADYELTGGDIANVMGVIALRAVAQDSTTIHADDLIRAIEYEMRKGAP